VKDAESFAAPQREVKSVVATARAWVTISRAPGRRKSFPARASLAELTEFSEAMKPRKIFPRLSTLLAAALLLTPLHPASAQRRRPSRRARTTSRPAATPTPQPATQTQPQTTPATTPTPAASADAQTSPTQQRAEPDAQVEDLLPADGYGFYIEVRRVGTLARAEELKAAVGALRLVGGEETEPVTDILAFFDENAEQTADSRMTLAFMPTRGELPQLFIALELPTSEAAARFEPKFRAFVGEKVEPYAGAVVVRANESAAAGAQKGASGKAGQGAQAQDAGGFTFRRVGRLLLTAEQPFTLAKLRGEEGTRSLAENVRFQTERSRFASDAVFVFVDTTLAQQGLALEERRQRDAQMAAQRASEPPAATPAAEANPSPTPTQANATTRTTTSTATPSPTPATTATPESAATQATPSPLPSATPQTQEQAVAQASPTPTPEATPSPEPSPVESVSAGGGEGGEANATRTSRADATAATTPSEEQVTVSRMSGILGNVVRGAPRVPGSVALGLDLKGGALSLRLAVENTPDGMVSVIPFLPNVLAGPPLTAAAAEVAPDDTDIFVTTSLDWTAIYTNTLGTASLDPAYTHSWLEGEGEGGLVGISNPSGGKQLSPQETVAAIEKLFGFKIKEDLLPALGNEAAVSIPFSYFTSPPFTGAARKKEGETDAEPGPAVIIALNDPDKVREILPRVLVAFSFVSTGAVFSPPEKREGFEIRSAVGFAYTIINNFLVVSDDVKAVRHVVDAYAARRTLAATDGYRDSTSWQSAQKVVQVFVSDAIMKSAIEETKKHSGGSTDPVVRTLLVQLDMTPEPASYEATNEGDVLLHEVRLPLNLLKAYAVSAMIAAKDATILSSEAEAAYALRRINDAEYTFKETRQKGRYGTLEELVAEKILEKEFAARFGYDIELNAVGDKFEATATPKTYGKTGRRSFFINEAGEVRGADHAGKPATADDPTID
jgi:hypothetical protein